MFTKFDEAQLDAVKKLQTVVERLVKNGGWAPIGGDDVAVRHAVGLAQDAGIVPVGDLRGSPAPEEYKGPIAFSSSPYDDPVQRGFKPGDRIPPGAACDLGPAPQKS